MLSISIPPPYYAVIFTSKQTANATGYAAMAEAMERRVTGQPGYLGMESARGALGITISYWESLEAIKGWKEEAAHSLAREKGKTHWYSAYTVKICKVEKAYAFEKE